MLYRTSSKLSKLGYRSNPRIRRLGHSSASSKNAFLVSPVVLDLKHAQRWGKNWRSAKREEILFAAHRRREAAALVKAANLELAGSSSYRVKQASSAAFVVSFFGLALSLSLPLTSLTLTGQRAAGRACWASSIKPWF